MNALFKAALFGTMLSMLSGCLPMIIANTVFPSKKQKSSSHAETHRRPLDTTQESSVTFYRKKQMVTVYDCNGHVVSHSLKTVDKKLSKTFTVDYPDRKKLWSQIVLNRRNGSQPVFPSRSEGQFTVDYSPTWNHIRVSAGRNEIEYVFHKCADIVTDPAGNKKCASKPYVAKEGIFLVHVDYKVIQLPGVSERHPDPTTCPHQ